MGFGNIPRVYTGNAQLDAAIRKLVDGLWLLGAGLSFDSQGRIQIDLRDTEPGLELAATGLGILLATDPGLEYSTGLRVKVSTGITRDSNGIYIANNAITNALLRDSSALSVIGRDVNTIGDPLDIVSSSNDTLLRRVSNALDWGQLTLGMHPANVITFAKLQQIAEARVLGRGVGAGTGDIAELTASQLLAIIQTIAGLASFDGTNWTDLTDGGATTLHTHSGMLTNPIGDDVLLAFDTAGLVGVRYDTDHGGLVVTADASGDANFYAEGGFCIWANTGAGAAGDFSPSICLTDLDELLLTGGTVTLDATNADTAVVTNKYNEVRKIPLCRKNFIAGLTTSHAADTDHDITIAAGECREASDAGDMFLTGDITKRIDAAWAVGTNAGGLDTGSVAANTLYAIWLIKRSDTGVVDALFSASFTAPTMPANYDYKRLIAAVKTNGSANILAYVQQGDWFDYAAGVTDVSDATITEGTFETGTLSVPPSCLANVHVHGSDSGTVNGFWSISLRRINSTVTHGTAAAMVAGYDEEKAAGTGVRVSILADSNKQIQYTAEEGTTTTVTIVTIGFDMITRRYP